ncbi:peptidoglycan hydrolase RipC [Mycolicibacterium confluentis]|uniref:Putative endopeptidase n=1 Tax=Mycolicibacterium confluentis TaxID=28047 RepID=A0A7I7XVJ8_9MYCO|nr:peptidoglycan hydrolase RipC [Mycolicibacterium confluentis]MCV7317971.1 C40 family peptidase [Mycolicibacterium confluentis]ORV23656.1 endopeptidase [Mycolicibacterium confluentis]BBZ33171.1 putative endopeptidase [Mycolicibacterium confluentis]
MRFDGRRWGDRNIRRPLKKTAIGTLAALTVLSGALASSAHADPQDDALAKLNELSRQAEQTTEAMHSAQLDLNAKLEAQGAADRRLAADRASMAAAQTELAIFQSGVNKFAAAMYMGGRTSGFNAILTAESPQGLIDKLSVQRVMAAEVGAQMGNYRRVSEQAVAAEAASAKSAAEAKTAAEQAAAVRADLQSKQSELQLKIAVVRSQYEALTPEQRVALAEPGPVPPAPEAPPGPDVLAQAPEGVPPGDLAPDAALPAMPGNGQGVVAVQAALTRVGSPYSWGGSGPGAFDCSGLVMWAFQQAGIALPHSSQALARGGQPVSRGELQPGDVVNFYSDASHTGIYVGDGMVVHASTYGVPVKVVPLDGAGPFYNARRY